MKLLIRSLRVTLLASLLAALTPLVPLSQAHADTFSPQGLVQPYLVRDINATTRDSIVSGQIVLNNIAYFFADDGAHGAELWRSDGTAAGTALVKDIAPGTAGSFALSGFAILSDTLYFAANDGVHGVELWRSDGTVTGTLLVKDIVPGSTAALKYNSLGLVPFKLAIYFNVTDPNGTCHLWRSDGTDNGTTPVKVISPCDESSAYSGGFNRPFQDDTTLYFFTMTNMSFSGDLWKSDGSPEGTQLIKHFGGTTTGIAIQPNQGEYISPWLGPTNFFSINGVLYFGLTPDSLGNIPAGIWKTDGTTDGTVKVLANRPTSSVAVLSNTFYFAGDLTHLYKSDGTITGTSIVTSTQLGVIPNTFTHPYAWNGAVYFNAHGNDSNTPFELWKTDGTEAGTVRVRQEVQVYDFLGLNDHLFFVNFDTHGAEVWVTDGSTANTKMVKDIFPGEYAIGYQGGLVAAGSQVFFFGNDGVHGTEPWKSDGTEPGTQLIKDIYSAATADASPSIITHNPNFLLFSATSGQPNTQVWSTDGTPTGTTVLPSLTVNPMCQANLGGSVIWGDTMGPMSLYRTDGSVSGTIRLSDLTAPVCQIATVGNIALFKQTTPIGDELWRTDGTQSGTMKVKNTGLSSITFTGPLNGHLIFFGVTNGAINLWRSDGTEGGTQPLKDNFRDITAPHLAISNTLYFMADDGVHGYEVWKTDGTAAGTQLVKDITPGTASMNPRNLFQAAGNVLIFTQSGGSNTSIWRSDGTDAGTFQLADPAMIGDVVTGTGAGKYVFFVTRNGLYATDGNSANTVRLLNSSLYFDLSPGRILRWFIHDDTLYFIRGFDYGLELWRSDGTVAGTVPVRALGAGKDTTEFTLFNNRMAFATTSSGSGPSEIWLSDGTPGGTFAITQIPATDVLINNIQGQTALFPVGHRLIWVASEPATGSELHALALESGTELYIHGSALAPAQANSINSKVNVHFTYGNSRLDSSPATLTATLSADLNYITDTLGVSPTLLGNSVVWNLPSVDFGSHSFSLQVGTISGTLGTRLPFTLTLAASQADPWPADNSAVSDVWLSLPMQMPIVMR